MPTLLLAPQFTEDADALWRAAISSGWKVLRVEGWSAPEVSPSEPLAYYGSLRPCLAALLARALGRGLVAPTRDWLPSLPADHLRRSVRLMTLAEARRLPGPSFVKPAEEKHFPARVYAAGSELPAGERLARELPVLVAEAVGWGLELRCFVRHRELLAHAPYSIHGSLIPRSQRARWSGSEDYRDGLALAQTALADAAVDLPPAFVLDVGRIARRGWAVVEANPAWGSALYGCDPSPVLEVLRCACIPASDVSRMARWLVDPDPGVLRG